MSGWLHVEYDKFSADDKAAVELVRDWAFAVSENQSYSEDDRRAAADVLRGLTYLMLPPLREVVTITKPPYEGE